MGNNITCNRKKETGFALISILLFLAVMGILSTTLIFTVQNEMKSSAAYKFSQQAFYISDAGVQKAIDWFRNTYKPLVDSTVYPSTPYPGAEYFNMADCPVTIGATTKQNVLLAGRTGDTSVFPSTVLPSTTTTYAASFTTAFRNKALTADSNNNGYYEVNAELMKYTPVRFIDINTFVSYDSATERWRLSSDGYWNGNGTTTSSAKIVAIVENTGNALFDKALWGIDVVDLSGAVEVDSYNPNLGPWNATTNSGTDGSIGSNGSITAAGTVDVYGDAAYGPTGSISGGTQIHGTITQMSHEKVFPPIPNFTIPAGSPSVTASGPSTTLTIGPGYYDTWNIKAGATLELSAGVYYVDSINETFGAVSVTGPVTIFVKSGLDLASQGIINPFGSPQEVTVYYSGTSEATMVGGPNAYMEVYAPNAPVKLAGNADFFGSYIGKELSFLGSPKVHFSLGCLDDNLLEQPFRVLSWTQQ